MSRSTWQSVLERFVESGREVLEAWPMDPEGNAEAAKGYPPKIPSFDEFVNDLGIWLEAQSPRRPKAPVGADRGSVLR
jgi:hypothetical protein